LRILCSAGEHGTGGHQNGIDISRLRTLQAELITAAGACRSPALAYVAVVALVVLNLLDFVDVVDVVDVAGTAEQQIDRCPSSVRGNSSPK
jgi:hypothetical protein